MPGGVPHGVATFPGVGFVESCSGTLSHGITPATFVLRCPPQDNLPASDGTLVITDGVGTIALPGCRFDALKVEFDDRGYYWLLSIVDRRWRWRNLGAISGCYNQFDPFGKLYPWTIRSPTELAVQCLEAMGETNYVINLPEGLNYPGPFTSTPIINITGTNPPVDWKGVPPAQALQQLADQYSCRVIYRWSDDTILITPTGVGNDLPTGGLSVHKQGPSLKNPETPDGIGVMGSATRYQVRLSLYPVGEDWDGSYRPIELLSYAPKPVAFAEGNKQVSQITVTSPSAGVQWIITIDTTVLVVDAPGSTVAASNTAIAAAINGNPNTGALVDAAVANGAVAVTAGAGGAPFSLTVSAEFGEDPTITAILLVASTPNIGGPGALLWQNCYPPLFQGINAPTPQLTLQQARALAQKSIYKTYAITNFAPDGSPGIIVPGYGRMLRREQIVLQDTEVDQIVPQPNDANIRSVIQPNAAYNVNFYNGYSRDKPAAVYGQIQAGFNSNNGIIFVETDAKGNAVPLGEAGLTPEGSQVFVPFSVDPVRFQISFSNYVYKWINGNVYPADLQLQTGCLVRDPVTNQIDQFVQVQDLGGASATNPRIYQHPDIQLNVTATFQTDPLYINYGMPTGFSILELDPLARAQNYLAAHALEYLISGGQVLAYNGIIPIDLDGAIQQVSWSVGDGGAETTASRNTEHDAWIPQQPERRRAEFLAPALQPFVAPWPKADMPNGQGGKA